MINSLLDILVFHIQLSISFYQNDKICTDRVLYLLRDFLDDLTYLQRV
jgi:hypothetical protein